MDRKALDKKISIQTYAGVNPPKSLPSQVASIHMSTFTSFFLTSLGKGFLTHLYKGYCMHSKSGLSVATDGNCVVGFLAYSKDLNGFYKYLLKKDLIPFAWYGFLAVLRKPSIIIRLFGAFLKPSESKRKENYIELASIGVSPEMENMHIGTQLVNKLKESLDCRLYAYIKLETDAKNNDAVNEFYRRNGFILAETYTTPEGRLMNEYRYS